MTSALPFSDQRPERLRHDVESWVQSWVQSCQIAAKTVYYDATPGLKNQYVRTSASVSGPGGRRFESSRPDHLKSIRYDGLLNSENRYCRRFCSCKNLRDQQPDFRNCVFDFIQTKSLRTAIRCAERRTPVNFKRSQISIIALLGAIALIRGFRAHRRARVI
jgi:hypothetical protein